MTNKIKNLSTLLNVSFVPEKTLEQMSRVLNVNTNFYTSSPVECILRVMAAGNHSFEKSLKNIIVTNEMINEVVDKAESPEIITHDVMISLLSVIYFFDKSVFVEHELDYEVYRGKISMDDFLKHPTIHKFSLNFPIFKKIVDLFLIEKNLMYLILASADLDSLKNIYLPFWPEYEDLILELSEEFQRQYKYLNEVRKIEEWEELNSHYLPNNKRSR